MKDKSCNVEVCIYKKELMCVHVVVISTDLELYEICKFCLTISLLFFTIECL